MADANRTTATAKIVAGECMPPLAWRVIGGAFVGRAIKPIWQVA
jgi:hypothetical protein